MEWLSNIGMREWLIGCGILLMMLVLFDGMRRMRSEHKKEIKMSLALGGGFPDDDEPDVYGSELPNGGARVIGRSEPTMGELENVGELASIKMQDEFEQQLVQDRKKQAALIAKPPQRELVTDQEIIILHVKSKRESGFNGSDLLEVLLACDMRYGEHSILHRHERAAGEGKLQFSVANMIEPGTFDLQDINSFRTSGITFFIELPGPEDATQAFECMLETANCVVKNLDASLLDDSHSTATLQVLNIYRERVARYSNSDITTDALLNRAPSEPVT